jgi:trehalose synthase
VQLQLVNVGTKVLADYASIATRGLMDQIRELAEPLQGKRVLHLSATAFGGGVAEILYTLVPLMRDAGLDVEWRIIQGADEFFDVTKAIHNALQGDPKGLTSEQEEIFRRYNQLNADALEGEYDFIIVHDPQPAGVIDHARHVARHWCWRCHIDLSEPNPSVLDFLLPWIGSYDATVFHRRQYVPDSEGIPAPWIWPPAIDPLAPKNMALSAEDASYIVDQFGIDVHRPLITQVSRFDPWKDPLGVIEAWRELRESHPDVQLALVGSMAHDDPEGWEYYNRTVSAAGGDPDIFILSNLNNVGSVEVNAFQVRSEVVLQKSIREGFGLTVTESLWKGRPTIAGRVGGIVDQIQDGETGYLVSSVEECAERTRQVLEEPVAHREMALRGKEYVRRRFLTPRLLRDWLVQFNYLHETDADVTELAAELRSAELHGA